MVVSLVSLLLVLCLIASNCVTEVVQPESFTAVLTRLQRSQETLLLLPRRDMYPSTLQVFEKFAVPSSQGWSRCSDCGLSVDGSIAIFDDDPVDSNVQILISWSLWGEFFHMQNNDKFYANRMDKNNFMYRFYIERPVFVLPLITLHVGHILVDIIEQLYQTHMRLYGRIRKDCVIILDVMANEERAVLSEKIHNTINFGENSPGFLLRLFTDLPIFSVELWNELQQLNGVVFNDLHIGLDISESHLNAGQQSQSCIVSLENGNAENMARAKRYQAFSKFIQSESHSYFQINATKKAAPNSPSVFIEQRTADRKVLNIAELLQISHSTGHITATGSLSKVTFRHQLELFASLDVLVAVAGTSLHNVLFMRPGSAVIMFMQPEWCEQAYMFVNQAVLQGLHPFVYCVPATPPVALRVDAVSNSRAEALKASNNNRTVSSNDSSVFRHYQWSRQFWLQGPRHHKADDVFVDPNVFAALLKDALEAVHSHRARDRPNITNAQQKTADLGTSMEPLICPGYTPLRLEKPSANTEDLSFQHGATFVPPLQRMVEMYIASVNVAVAADKKSWDAALVGEIGAARGNLAAIMRSMPHLNFCMETEDNPAWCYPVARFNYYTNLTVNMVLPRQNLHFWAQASSSGGKIRHSDVYVVIDCRLPEAGFALHTQVVGLNVHFEADIYQQCVETVTNKEMKQVLRYPSQKLAPPETSLICESVRRVAFQHNLVSRLSLQRFTADFCASHTLTVLNCGKFISALQQHLRRVLKTAHLGLPEVQAVSTVANPFFFMHVEKTAGSTLREYIYESLRAPNTTAFIPCHTTHCRVFALPEHSTQPLPHENAATADTFDWNGLMDLRLIQPVATDNSLLSVIAGHFDFYAAMQHLPQCRTSTTRTAAPWSPYVLSGIDSMRPVVPPAPAASPSCRVSCFTMGRHPVDRAISYYYQRVYQHPSTSLERSDSPEAAPFAGRPLNMRLINELTPAQLRSFAFGAREALGSHFYPNQQVIVDEGMSDAACRAVLGLKYTTGQRAGPVNIPPAILPALYPHALENMRQCVVGLQEQWNDTLRVLDHWFPWIDFATRPNRRRMALYRGQETRHTLRPELYQVLVQANPCDLMLYDEMQRLFHAQLSVLDNILQEP